MFKVCVSLQLLAPLLLFDGAKVRVFFILCNRLRRKSAEVRRFCEDGNYNIRNDIPAVHGIIFLGNNILLGTNLINRRLNQMDI